MAGQQNVEDAHDFSRVLLYIIYSYRQRNKDVPQWSDKLTRLRKIVRWLFNKARKNGN